MDNLELFIKESEADITLDLDPTIEIKRNQFHFENVIRNVNENGVKYGKSQPLINISAAVQDKSVALKIEDNGMAWIPIKSNIFDDFYRAETGNIHTAKGFGLGLSYSELMIDKMGGSIAVESELQNGTIITINPQSL